MELTITLYLIGLVLVSTVIRIQLHKVGGLRNVMESKATSDRKQSLVLWAIVLGLFVVFWPVVFIALIISAIRRRRG